MHNTRAFLQLWQGQALAIPDPGTLAGWASLRAWARSYHVEVAGWLGTLQDPALVALLPVPWSKRLETRAGTKPQPATLEDTLYQVLAHSTYHRGQVNTRLRELGVTPPLLDYIAWVWMGRPAAEWEADVNAP